MKRVLPILAIAAATALASPAFAQSGGGSSTSTWRAVASGPAENPPNGSPGSALVEIDISGTTLMIDMTFRDLTAPTVAAHVHCCTTDAFTGTSPVAVPFEGFPTGALGGQYSGSISLADGSAWDPAFLAAHGGTPESAAAALLAGMTANEAYVNIHTTAFPAGEIRGFVVAAPVPEPAEWGMLGMGLAGILWAGRRPKRQPSWQR